MKKSRWKPKIEETYYSVYIGNHVTVFEQKWVGCGIDKMLYKIQNVFKTEVEAEQKRQKILKEFLKNGN